MIIWMVIIIILLGISFSISLYIYDNSEFHKLTGISYFNILMNKKNRETYKLVQSLKQKNGDEKVLLNVTLPTVNHVIDAVIVRGSGIHIINNIHSNGWIYGREQEAQWAEALYREKLNRFDNPLIQNKIAILSLKELLVDIKPELFYSLVIFSNSCSFRDIQFHSSNTNVVKAGELKKYWKEAGSDALTKEQIANIHNILAGYMVTDKPETLQQNNLVAN